jgi:hypothetical protein
VRRFRVDLERPDPYWPAQLAALAAILLYVTLPNKLTIGPNWLVPILEVLVFVALVLTTPGEEVPGTRMRHRLAVALIGVLALVNLVALGLLAHYVVEGGAGGRGLVEAAVALWARSFSSSLSSTGNSIAGGHSRGHTPSSPSRSTSCSLRAPTRDAGWSRPGSRRSSTISTSR